MIFKVQWLKTLGFFCCWCELIKQREYNCMQSIFGDIFTSLQYRRPRFHPWIGKTPWRMKSYPLQYSGQEFHELYSPWGSKESDTTEKLSLSQDEDGLCSSYTRLLVLCEFLRRERKVWSESLDLEAALKGRWVEDKGRPWCRVQVARAPQAQCTQWGKFGWGRCAGGKPARGSQGVVWVQGREDWEKEVHTYLVCLVASIQAEFTRVKSNWCAEVKNASMSWI